MTVESDQSRLKVIYASESGKCGYSCDVELCSCGRAIDGTCAL
jgi:hypothetical protein